MSVYSYVDGAYLSEIERPLARVTEVLNAETVETPSPERARGGDLLNLSYYVDRSFGNQVIGGWNLRRRNVFSLPGGGDSLGAALRPPGTASPVVVERSVLRIGAGANFSGVTHPVFGYPPAQITGRLWLAADVALDDWSPAGGGFICGVWQPLFSQQSYGLQIDPAGTLRALMSTTGADTIALVSSVNLAGTADGARLQVGVDIQPNNGAGGKSATFYTAPAPAPAPAAAPLEYLSTGWTQLGAVVTGSGAITLFQSGAQLRFGSQASLSGTPIIGKLFACELRAGGGPPPTGTRILAIHTTDEYPGRTVPGTVTGSDGVEWNVASDGVSWVAPP